MMLIDTQLYFSFDLSYRKGTIEAKFKFQSCLSKIKVCIKEIKLMLEDDKNRLTCLVQNLTPKKTRLRRLRLIILILIMMVIIMIIIM